MPKLRHLSGAQIRAILEANGFTLDRQSGSHMILEKKVDGATVSVTVPNHREVAPGTLGSIIRQSGLGRTPFEA